MPSDSDTHIVCACFFGYFKALYALFHGVAAPVIEQFMAAEPDAYRHIANPRFNPLDYFHHQPASFS